MEPNHNTFHPISELPQPQELLPGSQLPEQQGGAARPETRAVQPPAAAPVATPTTAVPTIDPAMMYAVPAQPQPATNQTTASMQHLMADDSDLIEKEWVLKAKAIVMQTKDDPHMQNKEMTKVKADYLKKRYNKDLKVSEG